MGDIDFHFDVIHVTGKGSRPRALPFGNKTGQALDRYLRVRARHPHANSEALWLGKRGALTSSGVAQIVRRRGEEAGIKGLHPHMFRHTFAHRWRRGQLSIEVRDLLQRSPHRKLALDSQRKRLNVHQQQARSWRSAMIGV